MTENDLLCWSDELQAWFVNEEIQASIPEDYLFRVERFSKEFWTIATEMAQLNDYCVLFLQETFSKLNELKWKLKELEAGEKRVVVDEGPLAGDYTGETIMVLDEEIPIWEDTYSFIARATCLLLLSAFTEKSLKTLCDGLAPVGESGPRRNPGESKVAMYLRFLQEKCSIDFDEPKESIDLRGECRQLRNAFAHGDWDEVRAKVGRIHLRNAFGAVADLLYRIEACAWQSPWGKLDI